jgi:hypothetical protein
MGKHSRNLRLDNEWKGNYCAEATGIIVDLVNALGGHQKLSPELLRRINRLKAASKLYDELIRQRNVFVP